MVISKKSAKKEAPVIELMQARVRILEAELHPEPYEVTSGAGATFTVDPNLNCLIEVVDDQEDGDSDGMRFYDSFKLKQEDDGEWGIRDGTKLGNLAKAYYGRDYFEIDKVFDEEDLIGFEFMTRLQQKKDMQGNPMQGTICNHETIMAVPTKKKAKGPEAGGHDPTPQTVAQAQAEAANEADFENIPF